MDLLSFLTHKELTTIPTFCFVQNEYPLLCAALIKKKFKETFSLVIDLPMVEDEAHCRAQLGTMFFGNTMLYWLPEDCSNFPKLISYLVMYKGPHAVSFFSKDPLPKNYTGITVELPEEVDGELFMQLFSYIYPSQTQKYTIIIKKIFKQTSAVSLDTALLLINYCILIGNKSDAFIAEWLTEIVTPEKSLFSLSTYFFAKKMQQFFELWNYMSRDYSDLFWTTFWSEQLFKASAYISLNNGKNFLQAKRIAYRLPFSFIQKDWKMLKVHELAQAHNQLYAIDRNIKNGLNAHLEHFYLNFMLL